MAHGRPDWNTAINITGQDIAQVIERPMYGAANFAVYSDVIIEDNIETLFSITGTGMIYGGAIAILGAFDTGYIYIATYIDGVSILATSIYDLNAYQTEDKSTFPLFDQYYSEENDSYIIGITRGITFETSCHVVVYNYIGSGDDATIGGSIWYALI